MTLRLINIGLLLAFSICYMEWGKDQSAFVFDAIYEVLFKKQNLIESITHPVILFGLGSFTGSLNNYRVFLISHRGRREKETQRNPGNPSNSVNLWSDVFHARRGDASMDLFPRKKNSHTLSVLCKRKP